MITMLSDNNVILMQEKKLKVAKINDWFEKFGRFEVRHRWLFIMGLLIVTVVCSLGLPHLKLDNGEEDWFDDWETTKVNQDHFESIFGSTDTLLAHIKAEDVFAPEVLQMIDELGDESKQIPLDKSCCLLFAPRIQGASRLSNLQPLRLLALVLQIASQVGRTYDVLSVFL